MNLWNFFFQQNLSFQLENMSFSVQAPCMSVIKKTTIISHHFKFECVYTLKIENCNVTSFKKNCVTCLQVGFEMKLLKLSITLVGTKKLFKLSGCF
jgi:hypothetical protein